MTGSAKAGLRPSLKAEEKRIQRAFAGPSLGETEHPQLFNALSDQSDNSKIDGIRIPSELPQGE
ncbi:hypothetical protein [Shewanella baltica]|uniref:hypothetical protein n=1 Tax=Shewanella baltica TaxID=62322 RepID=UPI003CFE4491